MRVCAFSPNNRQLIAATTKGQVAMVDLDDDDGVAAVRNFTGYANHIFELEITSDGLTAITSGWDRSARQWKLESAAEAKPREFTGHSLNLTSIAVAANGGRLVTGSEDSTARVWDLDEPTASPLVLRGHDGVVGCVAISPDGRWVVTAASDVRLWDLDLDAVLERARLLLARELTSDEREQYLLGKDVSQARTQDDSG